VQPAVVVRETHVGSVHGQDAAARLERGRLEPGACLLEIGLAHAGLEGGGLAGTLTLSHFHEAETSATEVAIRAEGLQAVCFQHEVDHLEGTLFLDRISQLKRSRYVLRRKKQLRREQEEGPAVEAAEP